MSDKCFKKCVYKPGTSLDSSEQVSCNWIQWQYVIELQSVTDICLTLGNVSHNVNFKFCDTTKLQGKGVYCCGCNYSEKLNLILLSVIIKATDCNY